MLDGAELESIIESFYKSTTQSEAEVRSKLIVPLIEWLGYPSEYRSEEFPIYSFESGKKVQTKNADFLLFDDSSYAQHRKSTEEDVEWVFSHSLLVFEAKKVGEMPEKLDQPVYYAAFSRSTAYLVSDGQRIIGRIYNPANKDADILNCLVSELPSSSIAVFSFENVKQLKKTHAEMFQEVMKPFLEKAPKEIYKHIPVTEDAINLPTDLLKKMEKSLGKNARGLTKLQLVEKFLRTTDFILENDIRFDIPPHMIDVPRKICKSTLFIDDIIIPFMSGKAWIYYCNDYERISFISSSITIDLLYKNDKLAGLWFFYHVLDSTVSARINNLERVIRIHNSKKIRISIEQDSAPNREITVDSNKYFQKKKTEDGIRIEFWLDGLTKMKLIEEYYGIQFILGQVNPKDTFSLYEDVDYVCRGIAKQVNCHLVSPGNPMDEDIVMSESEMMNLGENGPEPLKIHNYMFIPKKVFIPACIIHASSDIVRIDVSIICEAQLIRPEFGREFGDKKPA